MTTPLAWKYREEATWVVAKPETVSAVEQSLNAMVSQQT